MIWSFYNPLNGMFTGRVYRGPSEDALELNLPEGLQAIEGQHDARLSRVDVESGAVVPYTPPQPSDGHVFAEFKRVRTMREIEALEKSQARPLRELLTDPANEMARDRLAAIDAEIAVLRDQL